MMIRINIKQYYFKTLISSHVGGGHIDVVVKFIDLYGFKISIAFDIGERQYTEEYVITCEYIYIYYYDVKPDVLRSGPAIQLTRYNQSWSHIS